MDAVKASQYNIPGKNFKEPFGTPGGFLVLLRAGGYHFYSNLFGIGQKKKIPLINGIFMQLVSVIN